MSSEPERLVIAGMPRSGTTLLATLLSAQRGCTFLTEYVPAFHAIAERLRVGFLTTLDEPARRIALAVVRDQFLRLRHPVMVTVDGFRTLDELHRAVMNEIAKPGDRAVGHKVVLRADQARKTLEATDWIVIVILRDPRDAALSFFHRTGGGVEQYVADWAAMVELCDEASAYPRLIALRYEELVRRPKETLAPLETAAGIAIDWEVGSLAFRARVAGAPTRFEENSAFGDVDGRFDHRPIERWREHLASDVVRYAGWACASELARLGYAALPPGTLTMRDRARFRARRWAATSTRKANALAGAWERLWGRLAPPLRHR